MVGFSGEFLPSCWAGGANCAQIVRDPAHDLWRAPIYRGHIRPRAYAPTRRVHGVRVKIWS